MEMMELEFKYDASKISRKDFVRIIQDNFKVKTKKRIINEPGDDTGDHYFTDSNGKFMRFRHGANYWELTTKVQKDKRNNWVRTEVNLLLSPGEMSLSKAKGFAEVFGLKPDFTVKKDAVIYWIDNVVISYYNCMNEKDEEVGRFIEIELDEDYEIDSVKDGVKIISNWEEKLRELGLPIGDRISKSLFQMYTRF